MQLKEKNLKVLFDYRHHSLSIKEGGCTAAFIIVLIFFLNAIFFARRVSSPVIGQDAWYFLDVFLRNAINGNLQLSDFFVKRHPTDHAQPLFKLIMFFEWRYFDLDFMAEALLGVLAALACAVMFHRIIFWEKNSPPASFRRCLAWLATCALLFSLNGDGATWRWSLVALENITTFIILLFMAAVWRAHSVKRYGWLAVATLILGVTSDDSAVIAVVCTLCTLLIVRFSDSSQRRSHDWKIIAVVAVIMAIVRIGYSHAPIVLMETGPRPVTLTLDLVWDRFKNGGWWMWVVIPLTAPVSYTTPFHMISPQEFAIAQFIVAALLLVAHIAFWRRAFRVSPNLPVFMAICFMLLSYAWVLGIIYGRVFRFGNEYLQQPRYILLYAGQLIALMVMWSDTAQLDSARQHSRGELSKWGGILGCLFVVGLQVPLSMHAWEVRRYEWAYEDVMARQIEQLAADPLRSVACVPELPVCKWSPKRRQYLTQLLVDHRLNVFSDEMWGRHRYLPKPPLDNSH